MDSLELARRVADTMQECVGRIKGVGDQQYSKGDTQKFETMSLQDLLQYAREEAQDIVNYGVMLDIRLARLQGALEKGFEAYLAEYMKGEEIK